LPPTSAEIESSNTYQGVRRLQYIDKNYSSTKGNLRDGLEYYWFTDFNPETAEENANEEMIHDTIMFNLPVAKGKSTSLAALDKAIKSSEEKRVAAANLPKTFEENNKRVLIMIVIEGIIVLVSGVALIFLLLGGKNKEVAENVEA
jgi:hypothetical protein